MIKIRIHYPSEEIEQSEIDALVQALEALEQVDRVYPVGRMGLGVPELQIVIMVASLLVIKEALVPFMNELAKLAAGDILKWISELFIRRKLARIPIKITWQSENDGQEICFRLNPTSAENLKKVMAFLPILSERYFEKMLEGWPSGVKSIYIDQDKKSGEFRLALGRDEGNCLIYAYDFQDKKWKKVRR